MNTPKPDLEQIRKMLDEWDKSGAVKTSLYYRLQSLVLKEKAV